MLKGYTLPRTPQGTSSLVASPPWHYVGNCLAVEFEADPEAVAPYLELPSLRPVKVGAGYRFSCAMTVDDLVVLRDFRKT